jgi:cytoskeletal protein RodZ
MSVRAKKAQKAPRSIRYLLSADSKLRKLSLKKFSERLKKATSPSRSARGSKGSGRARTSARAPWTISPQAMGLAAVVILVSAVLITARQPSQRVDPASVGAAPDAQASVESPAAETRSEPRKAGVSRAPAPAAARTDAAAAPAAKTPAVEPVKAAAALPTTTTRTVESAPIAAAVEFPARTPPQDMTSVTIMGCLERGKGTFRLTDTAGEDAPTSRSWKSGFLKKRRASIEVLDPAGTLRLPNYVGQRVAATGVLVDREMQARSVRRTAGTCD